MALIFVDTHNQGGFLSNPPIEHEEFTSMITVLRDCPLTHALRVNPIIYENQIVEFWTNAQLSEDKLSIVSTVQGT